MNTGVAVTNGTFTNPFLWLSIILVFAHCKDSGKTKYEQKRDTVTEKKDTPIKPTIKAGSEKISVLVLPPYDEIGNEGISPEVQDFLEAGLSNYSSINLVKFSFKKMMGVSYQNIFDQKFCKPIINKEKTDFLLMSKLDRIVMTGHMKVDRWNLRLRIYNTNSGIQFDSKIKADGITASEMKSFIDSHLAGLVNEIKNFP